MATTTSQLALAWSLLQRQENAGALALAAGVLAAEPKNVSALACHAMASWAAEPGNAGALAQMEQAIGLAPRDAPLRYNFGNLLGSVGRLDEAAEQFRAALKLNPDDPQAFWGLSRNARLDDDGAIVARMERVFAGSSVPPAQRELLAYGLAKGFDDLDMPEKAISYASEGGRLAGRTWDQARAQCDLDELRGLAEAGMLGGGKTSGHPTRLPLFIVGMPRSGTTLIETILSRHPEVLALGESKQIPSLYDEARFRQGRKPGGVSPAVGRDWLAPRAEALVKGWLAKRRPTLVTDKMPDNAYMLGFIRQLFPRARVIYARRHPLDTGVSNFLTRYGEGQGFSYRLDWIGQRSRQLAETMQIWKRALDLELLEVSYEKLVADPEPEIRRIADFAGLGWTDALLSPEQSPRLSETASQWQVRQPIYRSSVGRWKRYEPWIGPMIAAMGGLDWAEGEASRL